ncbi:MAG: carbamoyltransferase HypF [Elusimicrobia bacterium]|nr:carbamoyltransferase HypF [Elusimicrobiota bacterium]
MHESGLIKAVLGELSRLAGARAASRVLEVRVRLPEDGHGDPETFRLQLELAARGTAAEGARFDVRRGPAPADGALIERVRLEGALRLRLSIAGAVQGVGFRPFVHRLAADLGLRGFVLNDRAGVAIEVEGPEEALSRFASRVRTERPAGAEIAALETTWLEPVGLAGFEIRESRGAAPGADWIQPDLAACAECSAEARAKTGRRSGYPFATCARCGPRFTILTSLPYDRPRTTLAAFALCPACAREYADPGDRRFHAQAIACPACGPRLWLEPGKAEGAAALEGAARRLESGAIVALKGIGGFLLLCDARSAAAVRRLRERKGREEKPFAVMFPDMDSLLRLCEPSPAERDWLTSAAAPIVLVRRKAGAREGLAAELAPGNPRLGALLPYSPLHHLLLERLGFAVVATSGNRSEEPIATGDEEARERLSSVADAFLLHDRPIARHADDSIVRSLRGRQALLRRARGFAPMPLRVAGRLKRVLAVGAQLKSTVALALEDRIAVSQHIGDLDTAGGWETFQRVVADQRALFGFEPELVACDLHPDYRSTRFAESLGLPVVRVQHHHAHIAACMAEQEVEPPALGAAFDGFGLGADGGWWGGEFLIVDRTGFRRFAHLRTFPLPGGLAAAREPRRSALGLLLEGGADAGRLAASFGGGFSALARLAGDARLSPRTSSVGRLFDAAAALLGLRSTNAFEGQAAMALEHALEGFDGDEAYPMALTEPGAGAPLVADWGPMLERLLADLDRGVPKGRIALRFHNGLARLVVEAATRAGLARVVLSGGVFQNAYLTETASGLLEAEGFAVHTPQRLPPNDGGLSAGQAYVAGLGWV